ncbi:hypothetical protein BU26DRAFT_287159 [Trematosphaeria pertusa]|uniref:Uncharacterized protein n=1 Tax=Trematosphaeria pertusa TaxID=390896 RepID=A0A6A6IGE7_9PLEO|nr:uncharacterized protein BU26DRAFT_287159 [Trematosphaeria pertusa]KAF2249664.1 hypothetical protein BU26DRAFT_287159 [Trematosphaeria pertusa]
MLWRVLRGDVARMSNRLLLFCTFLLRWLRVKLLGFTTSPQPCRVYSMHKSPSRTSLSSTRASGSGVKFYVSHIAVQHKQWGPGCLSTSTCLQHATIGRYAGCQTRLPKAPRMFGLMCVCNIVLATRSTMGSPWASLCYRKFQRGICRMVRLMQASR